MTTRNSNARFELAPQADIERSAFDRSFSVKTSFNTGELVPFMLEEILPGDSVDIRTSKVARLQTLLAPVMDNLYLDTYYFFVPNRLVWEHWKNLMGEAESEPWVENPSFSVPQIQPPADGWSIGTVADYFGIPTGQHNDSEQTINALPFRAYAKIVDDWFIDENLQYRPNIPMGDSDIVGNNGTNYVTDLVKGGKVFTACKFHDYFTSCLPAPYKMDADISFLAGWLPVVPRENTHTVPGTNPVHFVNVSGSEVSGKHILTMNNGNVTYNSASDSSTYGANLQPNNLWAALTNQDVTINSLRQAFQIQRLYERDARSGTRYIEVIKSHFGVTSPDARLQRAEYLGGNRIPLNIDQVVQTSQTADTPQGNVTGWSQTNDYSDDVHKSFTEHGYLIGLMCARYDHSYQQGLERLWRRKDRLDFYWPVLAHLGEQAVYTEEIYWEPSTDDPRERVFGYQEAWAEYRYKPNYITGQMRSSSQTGFHVWHFADNYQSRPYLDGDWIIEDKSNIDRTLAVRSAQANQIFIDIMCDSRFTRPMPLYSIPGFIDHF